MFWIVYLCGLGLLEHVSLHTYISFGLDPIEFRWCSSDWVHREVSFIYFVFKACHILINLEHNIYYHLVLHNPMGWEATSTGKTIYYLSGCQQFMNQIC
jgi:hypothetical protein